jgi:hypothetical protein
MIYSLGKTHNRVTNLLLSHTTTVFRSRQSTVGRTASQSELRCRHPVTRTGIHKALVRSLKESLGLQEYTTFRDVSVQYQHGELDLETYYNTVLPLANHGLLSMAAQCLPNMARRQALLHRISQQHASQAWRWHWGYVPPYVLERAVVCVRVDADSFVDVDALALPMFPHYVFVCSIEESASCAVCDRIAKVVAASAILGSQNIGM